jgi:hypothetical protein
MLQNHKAIAAPPECGFSHWWLSKYGAWCAADNTNEKISFFLDEIFSSKKIELWKLNKDEVSSIILQEKPENYSELVQCIYLAYKKVYSEVDVIADKNNYYIHHLDDLPQIWPNAKYLHIIRDGRDVACSYSEVTKLDSKSPYKPNFPVSMAEIAAEWENNNIAINTFANVKGRTSLLIKYEDVVTQTYETLLSICRFLEIEFDEQMLDYYKATGDNNQEPNETLDWKRKTLEKPDNNRIKRYLKDLTPVEIATFNENARTALPLFGYV